VRGGIIGEQKFSVPIMNIQKKQKGGFRGPGQKTVASQKRKPSSVSCILGGGVKKAEERRPAIHNPERER